jgi:hypothetical protein
MKSLVSDAFSHLGSSTEDAKFDWKALGEVVMKVTMSIITAIAAIVAVVTVMVSWVVRAARQIFFGVVDLIITPFQWVYNAIVDIIYVIGELASGDISGTFRKLGSAILKFVLTPIKLVLRTLVRLGDAVGAKDLIPQGVRDFLNKGTFKLTAVDDLPKIDKARTSLEKKTIVTEQASRNQTEEAKLLGSILDAEGAKRDAATAASNAQLGADVKDAVSKQPCIENTTSVNLDGGLLARSTSKHQQELRDRAGFKATPYQRRMAVEQGAVAPVRR